jgi:prepilin-type N-terminal cleavage/methylation domain-containing protein
MEQSNPGLAFYHPRRLYQELSINGARASGGTQSRQLSLRGGLKFAAAFMRWLTLRCRISGSVLLLAGREKWIRKKQENELANCNIYEKYKSAPFKSGVIAMKTQKLASSKQAFSLFELLLTISILAVIATMAMVSFGGVNSAAKDKRDMRNAQEIASMAAMASAAGANFVVPNDEAATVQNLVDGRAPTSGLFKGRTFKLPPLESHAVTGAMRYLALNNTELTYQGNNGAGGNP